MSIGDREQPAEANESEECPSDRTDVPDPARLGGAYCSWVSHSTTLDVGYTDCKLQFGYLGLSWKRHPSTAPGWLAGGWRPATAADPDQCPTRAQGGAAVDALQVMLGEMLLALAGLAVVLLAVILVLAEVDLILRLTRRLARRPSTRPAHLAAGREASGD